MNVLTIGGTGTVGSQVVRELLRAGVDVSVLTRNPEKYRLPAGVASIRGDLLNPETARTAFHGFDAVFMLNASGPTEAHEGLMGVGGALAARVKRFVYLSIHQLEARQAAIPHFGAKIAVEAAVRNGGFEWTIVRPNNFFQNDYWFKEAILKHGIYPQPLGDIGLSRVDVRDIAKVAAIALTKSGHAGRVYELAGPAVQTGEMAAAAWAKALGRSVEYAGNNLQHWESAFKAYLPPTTLHDYRMMYAWFQAYGLVATPRELEQLTAVLGHSPRNFETFTQETAAAWSTTAPIEPQLV